MGERPEPASPSEYRTPASAKITIILQTILILFLAYWAIEEYLNNIYFQSYVNTTLRANTLLIGGVVLGIPTLGALTLFLRRRGRLSTEHSVTETGVRSSPGSFGVTRSSSGTSGQKVSPLYAELSSRFGQSLANPNVTSDQGPQPVLQRTDQASTIKPRPAESRLPVLERVEPQQQSPQQREDVTRYQPPRQISDSPINRGAGYSPSPPSFPRPPDNPPVRRPPISAPTVRPATVVTGIMGPSPGPYTAPPPQIQGPIRQAPSPNPQPILQKWEPGVRPPAPLISMPQRPTQVNPSNPTGPGPQFGTSLNSSDSPGLSRIGPTKSPGDKTPGTQAPSGLTRVEPVQAVVASKPPWPKNNPPSPDKPQTSSLPQGQGLDSSTTIFPDQAGTSPFPIKRDQKRDFSNEDKGS